MADIHPPNTSTEEDEKYINNDDHSPDNDDYHDGRNEGKQHESGVNNTEHYNDIGYVSSKQNETKAASHQKYYHPNGHIQQNDEEDMNYNNNITSSETDGDPNLSSNIDHEYHDYDDRLAENGFVFNDDNDGQHLQTTISTKMKKVSSDRINKSEQILHQHEEENNDDGYYQHQESMDVPTSPSSPPPPPSLNTSDRIRYSQQQQQALDQTRVQLRQINITQQMHPSTPNTAFNNQKIASRSSQRKGSNTGLSTTPLSSTLSGIGAAHDYTLSLRKKFQGSDNISSGSNSVINEDESEAVRKLKEENFGLRLKIVEYERQQQTRHIMSDSPSNDDRPMPFSDSIVSIKSENAMQKEQILSLKRSLHEKERKIESMQHLLQEKDNMLKAIQEELDMSLIEKNSIMDLNSGLREQNEELERRERDLEDEISRLTIITNEQADLIQTKDVSLNNLREQINKSQLENKLLHDQMQEQDQQRSVLEQKLYEMQEQNHSYAKDVEKIPMLENQMKQIQKENQQLRATNASLLQISSSNSTSPSIKAPSSSAVFGDNREEFERRLRAANEAVDAAHGKIEEYLSKNQNLEARLRDLNRRYAQAEKSLLEVRRNAEVESKSLKNDIDDMSMKVQNIEEHYMRVINEKEEQLQALKNENEMKLQQKTDQFNDMAKRLKLAMETKNQQQQHMSSSSMSAPAAVSKSRQLSYMMEDGSDYQMLKTKYDHLEKECKLTKQDLQGAREEIEVLTKELTLAKTRFESLHQKFKDVREQARSLKYNHQQYPTHLLGALQDAINAINHSLYRSTLNMETFLKISDISKQRISVSSLQGIRSDVKTIVEGNEELQVQLKDIHEIIKKLDQNASGSKSQ